MDMWIIWLIVAAGLLLIEILTQMVWTLCLAVGCLGAMVAELCGANLSWQLAVLAITAVVAYIILMPMFKKWHERSAGRHAVATGMEALIGRQARVVMPIEPPMLGRAVIDGDNWQVRCHVAVGEIPVGATVEVVAYEGNILDVKPL